MKSNRSFLILTLVLISFIIFFTAGTVQGQEKGKEAFDAGCRHNLEQDYVKEIREYLNETGYENSGVMLTKVFDDEGIQEYTLKVHHKRFSFLSEDEKTNLREKMQNLAGEFGGEFSDLQIEL